MEKIKGHIGELIESAIGRIQPAHYTVELDTEYYGENLPVRRVFKNGKLVNTTLLSLPVFTPQFYTEVDSPTFAQGRCRVIGAGDYKTVLADQDGESDEVIKIYQSYRGPQALERAQYSADIVGKIYDLIREICGEEHYLPSRMLAGFYSRSNPDIATVYEIQKRGIFVDPFLVFEPKKAEEVMKLGEKLGRKFNEVVIPEFHRRKIIPISRTDRYILERFAFLPQNWDLVTNNLVGIDVIDHLPELKYK